MAVALYDDGEVRSNNISSRSVIIYCTITIELYNTKLLPFFLTF